MFVEVWAREDEDVEGVVVVVEEEKGEFDLEDGDGEARDR